MSHSSDIPDIGTIRQAYQRIRNRVRTTPVLHDAGLDKALSCRVYCKCEHLQYSGAFKYRGASNAIARLREDGREGDLATHSSGNHGAALALAARLDGRIAHVVMPDNASKIKIDAVKRHGGTLHFCAPTQSAREAGLNKLVDAGYFPIPPYDDFNIIAGQGTVAIELLQSHPDLELLIAPVGGGGLVSGMALVATEHGVTLYAAEPSGAADTAASVAQGQRVTSWQPHTIADGLRALVGVRNFTIIRDHVAQVLTVTDQEISKAMLLFWQHLRMLIEPSSAVAIAAIGKHPEIFSGKKVGVVITGANISPTDWITLVETAHENE